MPTSSRREDTIINLFVSAYEDCAWKNSCIDWLDRVTDGAVEALITRTDGKSLAIEHTLIEPFVGERTDLERFKNFFLCIEDDPALCQADRIVYIYVPCDALLKPGFPFWPSWSVYDSRLPAAMQRFSHCCQVRYSFRCRSGLRMLADHGVPAKPEGPLATPLPRRPSATRVRWLFRAVDVTLRAQVAPKSAAACRRTTSGSDAPPQAATNNIARASRAVRPS